MYRINPLEYQAYLDQAKGQLAQAEADYARATADVVRYEPLVKENAISREEYETSVSIQKASAANVSAARAAVQKARLDLELLYCQSTDQLALQVRRKCRSATWWEGATIRC